MDRFLFFVTVKVTFSLKNCYSKEEKRLCIDCEALVCFMNDIEYDAPDETILHFIRKAKLKKMYTQAAHIISQQTLLSACTPSLYPSCALLSVYIEPVSDELFYMRFKIFKNKISLYVKKVVWEKN